MAEKSRDAFRTISEVADWLDVPTHVLRFWESRFSQIKPVKRAGGRRYYRPSDMRIIGGVKVLLHDQGMTIRGVQKLFREEGVKHVSGFSPDLYGEQTEPIAAEVSAPLDQAALEEAARPASPARTTRQAEPAPIPDDANAEQAEPVFRRRPASEPAARPEPAESPELAFLPEAATDPDAVSKEAPAAPTVDAGPVDGDAAQSAQEAEPEPTTPAIPPTPNVPDTDPADDDPAHERDARIAARLFLTDPADLEAHRDTVEAAATRLRALLDRAS